MIAQEIAAAARGRLFRRRLQCVLPAAALGVFALFALLYAAGLQSAGLVALRFLGIEPGPFPFLDIHAVLAAAECQRQRFDVYVAVPCDVYGRVHVYSPLWLPLVPFGTAATAWVGAALVLACVLVLPLLIKPRSGGEVAIFALAVFSPATLYAMERANNDLVVFLIVVGAGLLLGRARWQRLCSYALIVFAALLKYYPGVLLALIARERRRDAICCALFAGAALALFAAEYRDELGRALANIPVLSYYTDAFSAKNLPFGFVQLVPLLRPAAPYAIALFAAMTYFALARSRRTMRLLGSLDIGWATREMRFAAIGGLLLTACFFAGQNINYRSIYFLLVLPGLVRLRGDAAAFASGRRWASAMIAALLFVMWGEFFRRALVDGILAAPGDLGNRISALFWLLREFVWWWLIAGLAALAAGYIAQLPLARECAVWVARRWPATGRVREPSAGR